MKKLKDLEEKLYNTTFIKKDNETMETFFNIVLPYTLSRIEPGDDTQEILNKERKNFKMKFINHNDTETDIRTTFFDNFYNYLRDVYRKDYLEENILQLVEDIQFWHDAPIDLIKEIKLQEYSLNTKQEEEQRNKLGVSLSKVDLLKRLHNARVEFNPESKKLTLLPYSKKGLSNICNSVDFTILRSVDGFVVDDTLYTKKPLKMHNNTYILEFFSDSKDDIIAITKGSDLYSTQHSFFSSKAFENQFGKSLLDLDNTKQGLGHVI